MRPRERRKNEFCTLNTELRVITILPLTLFLSPSPSRRGWWRRMPPAPIDRVRPGERTAKWPHAPPVLAKPGTLGISWPRHASRSALRTTRRPPASGDAVECPGSESTSPRARYLRPEASSTTKRSPGPRTHMSHRFSVRRGHCRRRARARHGQTTPAPHCLNQP